LSNSRNHAKRIDTPVVDEVISKLEVGNRIEIYGNIFTARDAVLPVLRTWIEQGQIDRLKVELKGFVIMHAGFSVAGFGPTTSNKAGIEGSISTLAAAGVKIHIGKGALSSHNALRVTPIPIITEHVNRHTRLETLARDCAVRRWHSRS